MTYNYDWDKGRGHFVNGIGCDEFHATNPVPENAILVDTQTGDKFVVEAILPALPPDLPKPTMRTRSAGKLNDEQLGRLRKRAHYPRFEFQAPLDDLVFFTKPEELQAILA